MNKKKTKTANNAADISVIPKTPFRFVWFFSKRHKKWAILSTIMVIAGASLASLTSVVYKYIVDGIMSGNTEIVLIMVLAFPTIMYIEMLFWRGSGFAGMNWITGMEYDTYNSLVAYTSKHSHTYFIDRFAGSLLSKVDNVVDSSKSLAADYLWSHLETSITIITSLALVFYVDLISGILFASLLTLLIIVNKNLAPKQKVLSRKNAETHTVLRGNIVDTFTNITAVRHHAAHLLEAFRLEKFVCETRVANKRSWFFSETTVLLNMTILFVFSIAIMYVLSLRWNSEAISAGDLVLVMAIFTTVSSLLIRLGRAFNETSKAYGKMEEGLTELIVEHEITDDKSAKKLIVKEGRMSWNKVNFQFENNRVFKNFDLTIHAGQRVGLVGASGAGKTTFVSLLLRQHDIDSGSIEIDGQNISEVTQDSLRKNIAVVPQEPLLFHRSIKENIAYGDIKATQKQIEDVAKKAQAHEFIVELPDGYNTLVGERGIKLSGGQKQRVAIARAMLKDSPILILDEATSALDSESEVAIQKALHKLMKGKTVVAVAHRLSTLREMDRILVLDNGEIVEDGTHDELSRAGGTYQRLWEHQAGGFVN